VFKHEKANIVGLREDKSKTTNRVIEIWGEGRRGGKNRPRTGGLTRATRTKESTPFIKTLEKVHKKKRKREGSILATAKRHNNYTKAEGNFKMVQEKTVSQEVCGTRLREELLKRGGGEIKTRR